MDEKPVSHAALRTAVPADRHAIDYATPPPLPAQTLNYFRSKQSFSAVEPVLTAIVGYPLAMIGVIGFLKSMWLALDSLWIYPVAAILMLLTGAAASTGGAMALHGTRRCVGRWRNSPTLIWPTFYFINAGVYYAIAAYACAMGLFGAFTTEYKLVNLMFIGLIGGLCATSGETFRRVGGCKLRNLRRHPGR